MYGTIHEDVRPCGRLAPVGIARKRQALADPAANDGPGPFLSLSAVGRPLAYRKRLVDFAGVILLDAAEHPVEDTAIGDDDGHIPTL